MYIFVLENKLYSYILWKIYAVVFILERKKLELLMSVVLIFCACILAERGWERVMSSQVQAEEKKWTVVIDAGHGGTPDRPEK